MGLITMVIVGGICGWIASVAMRSSSGILMDTILGIIGALAGGLVMERLGQPSISAFSLTSLVIAILGATFLIWIGRLLMRSDRKRVYA